MLTVFPIPAFSDNYIWCAYDRQTRQAILVDPGDSVPAEAFLKEEKLELIAVLITHHHPDHIGGLKDIISNRPNLPIYGPANESIPYCTRKLKGNDQIKIAELDLTFKIFELPGHTLGHIAYYQAGSLENQTDSINPLLFCGDTLFSAGCGRLFEGSPVQMHNSLQKLADLPPETIVYCTHEYTLANLSFATQVEPTNQDLKQYEEQCEIKRSNNEPTLPTSIGLELKINPFLRCSKDSIHTTAIQKSKQNDLAKGADTFAIIRQWKDNF